MPRVPPVTSATLAIPLVSHKDPAPVDPELR
jgi:hypothetical protein